MKPLYYFASGILAGMLAIMYMVPNKESRIHVAIAIPANVKVANINGIDTVQLDCMARNIFFEARSESDEGKAMVGEVVLNRTKSPHFPNTICGVVEQANRDVAGNIIKHKCSFSWYCDGKKHHINYHNAVINSAWDDSYRIAKMVMLGEIKTNVDLTGVTHYHANYVNPKWSRDHKDYKLVIRIGNHLFYRWTKATMPVYNPPNQLAMN